MRVVPGRERTVSNNKGWEAGQVEKVWYKNQMGQGFKTGKVRITHISFCKKQTYGLLQ